MQTDLYGQNILHITHPEDHHVMKQQLIPMNMENLFETVPDTESGECRARTKLEEAEIDRRLSAEKRSFTVRLARAGPRSDATVYEVVKIDGNFRRSDEAPRGIKMTKLPNSLHVIRRSRCRDDTLPLHMLGANDVVLTAVARVIRAPKIIDRTIEINKLEYKTRHLIDGRIIDCDQRISIVTGYMKDEVRNLSPFTFMHQDDARWVIVALRQMYDHHSSYGESTFRLMTRNGNFVFLQTKGYLEIDKHTNKVHSFVCINTLLNHEEGRRRMLEMKKNFSFIINAKIPQSSIDIPASQNPQQLEKAVMCLIQNLEKSSTDKTDDEDQDSVTNELYERSDSPSNDESVITCRESNRIYDSTSTSCGASRSGNSLKSPPLALVPPEEESVKDSLSKSVNMVSEAAAKLLPCLAKSPTTILEGESGDDEASRYDSDVSTSSLYCTCRTSSSCCEFCQGAKEPTKNNGNVALKRANSAGSDIDDVKLKKFRLNSTDIKEVLTSSLNHIGRSLNQQLNAAMELQDQSIKYEVPHSHETRLHEIMAEHQKQSELFVNIKSEYEVQMQSQSIDVRTTKA